MGKNLLVGVGSKARHVKALYVGVGGKARKVKKVYVGVGGKARLVWQDYVPVTGISATISGGEGSSMAKCYGYVTVTVTPDNATNPALSFSLAGATSHWTVTQTSNNTCTLYCSYGYLNKFTVTLVVTSADKTVNFTVICDNGRTWSIS